MESTTRAALVQPSLSPGLCLAPALVNGQRVWVEHPSWCTTDHVVENARFLEDVAHAGDLVDLVVPGGDPSYRLLVHAHLGADLAAVCPEGRATAVVVDNGAEEYRLLPSQADEFAARLITFAEAVRALARIAGGSPT